MRKVCVFGSYKYLGKKERNNIVKLGKLLAEKGFEVITGGFGGTMEDVSRGVKEAGGKTIGVTYYKKGNLPYKKANKYIDREIRTKDIFERINIMMTKSDAFIILPGGTGTLLELAACLELVNKGLMKPKPIVMLGNFWKSTIENFATEPVLNDEARTAFNALSCRDLITFVDTPEQLIQRLKNQDEKLNLNRRLNHGKRLSF